MILYHGSDIQNLKILLVSYNPKHVIHASGDKAYASAFTFRWQDKEVKLGKYEDDKEWTIEIPEKLEHEVFDFSCSIYEVSSANFSYIDKNKKLPEFFTHKNIDVLIEEKYTCAYEAMVRNNLKIKWV